jgi:hypothetical protein
MERVTTSAPQRVCRGVLLLLIWIGSVAPAVAQGVGAIGGVVMDPTGAVLPGVAITLSRAESTVGSHQETISDSRGVYQFLRLVPGTYTVRGQLAGFRAVEQQNLVVNADVTSRADLTLAIGQLEEGVVVSGEAPLLDTTSALRQTALSQEVLQMLPNRGDLWSITRVIPSIVMSKVDVGGSEGIQQSAATVHGTATESQYLIDGMDISGTDSSGNNVSFYLDPYAYAETNFQVGNAPAESSRGGLVYNMITRTGTNQVHGGGVINGMNSKMGFNNVSGALKDQILRNIPARILTLRPNLIPGAEIRYLYDYGGFVSGPIAPDKLWYSASVHHQQILQYLLGSYNPDGTQVPDDNYLMNASAKLAWQMSRTDQISYFYTLQDKGNGHLGGTAASFVESGATTRVEKWPQLHQVKWTSSLSSKMVFDASASRLHIPESFSWPKPAKDGDIAGFDQVTNTFLTVLPTYPSKDSLRMMFQSSLSYFTTAHEIKVGYQFNHMGYSPTTRSTSGMRAVYRNGVPDSVNTYNTPTFASMKDRETSLYVQDRWRPMRKLTFNVGLRLDNNTGWVAPACQEATQFVSAQCYAALKGVSDWNAVSPRFSGIYDLAGDGRTALKFSMNRYVTPVGSTILQRLNPNAVVSDTRSWTLCAVGQTGSCDLNGDRLPQVNELGPSSGYPFGSSNHYADGTVWPQAIEYSAEIQRQLPGAIVATIGYTYRQTRNNLSPRNVLVPTSAYTPVAVTEANSGRAVTVFNQDPALRGKVSLVWDNEPLLNSTYSGADISLNKRLSNHWMTTGGVSIGKNVGYVQAATSDLNNPNVLQFSRGRAGNDVPFSLRLSGLYELPYGVSASATFQHQSGFPETTTVSVGNNTIPLTQGTTSVIVESRGTTRLPNLNQLDASFRKAFRSGSRVLQPRVDLYNLMNSATVLNRTTVLGPSYGLVNGIQRGRVIKLGASFDF